MGDFLAGGNAPHSPILGRSPPVRPAYFTDDAVFQVGAVHRSSGVSQRVALYRHFLVQFRCRLRRVESNLEFRTLVFLNIEMGRTIWSLSHINAHRTHKPIARRGETSGEGAVVVAAILLAGDFFVV